MSFKNPTYTGFVYLLIKDCDIIYVGSTQNPERRLKDHRATGYDFYVLIPCVGYLGLEIRFIQFHNPSLNIVSKINHRNGMPLKTIKSGDIGIAVKTQTRPIELVYKMMDKSKMLTWQRP